MFILTEKIETSRRAQIFNDYLAEDAARKMREKTSLTKQVLDDIAAIVRSYCN